MNKTKSTHVGASPVFAQNSGITLVALVITIIVLIILAGVSINAVMNGGLIENAKGARDSFNKEKDKEQLELAKLEGTLAVETLKEVKAGEYTGTENKKYVEGGKTAVIPAGFTVSNIAEEKTISGGLVIYSGNVTDWSNAATVQSSYNQYVWIPMENPSDMYGILDSGVEGIEGNKFGKLYFKTKTDPNSHYNWPTEAGYSATSYREPAVILGGDTNSQYYKTILGYNSVEEYKAGMAQEFNNMITSVEKYKGFYIGRYELTGTAAAPTVKKGLAPLGNTNWYNFYKACTNLETGNEEAKDKVRTSMIWGCQWDQAVKRAVVDEPTFLTSPEPFGWYSDSDYNGDEEGLGTKGVQVTGLKKGAYNIYDMGGNVDDWTLEASVETTDRSSRGCGYLQRSTSFPASYRSEFWNLYSSAGNLGCRSQLYIK